MQVLIGVSNHGSQDTLAGLLTPRMARGKLSSRCLRGVKQMDRRLGRASIDALMQIPRRAERQSHHTFRGTFVEIGPLFSTLKRPEHQVMYGRRGTGKTHALGNLQSYLEQQNICVIYLDMRTVGSAGGIYSDPREPVATR